METVDLEIGKKLYEMAKKFKVQLPIASKGMVMLLDKNSCYPIYYAQELLKWLPKFIKFYSLTISLTISLDKDLCSVEYIDNDSLESDNRVLKGIYNNSNIADAIALMAIWLIENGYITNKN